MFAAVKESEIIKHIANWIWSSSSPPKNSTSLSPEACLESIPFLTQACLSTLVTKILGLCMILGSCLNKAPVLLNILKTKSTVGLSLGACYGEVLLYSNAAFYGIVRNIPFTAWGENGVMTLQALLICVLYWKFFIPEERFKQHDKKDDDALDVTASSSSIITAQHKILALVFYALYVSIILFLLPQEHASILQVVNWPVLLYSRGAQIHYTYKVKHTGTQSVITSSMNSLGSIIRIGTTLQEIGLDFALLFGFGLSLVLNMISLFQFYLYSVNTRVFLDGLSRKGQKIE